MRIAIFHHLRAGGAKRALYEYANALTHRGHLVDAFTLETADENFLPLAGVSAHVYIETLALPQRLQTRWLPFALQYVNLARRFKALDALEAAQARIASRIDAGGYDVAFVHPDYMVQSPYLLRYLRTPSIYYCPEPLRRYYEYPTEPPTPTPSSLKGRIQAAWYAPIEPLYARRHKADDAANARAASMVVTNSLYSCESIRRAYGLSARVATLGVDPTLFHPLDVPREHAVISVGRFQANKNQALLIDAVARLEPASRPKVILVGESSGTAAYRDGLIARARARDVDLELLEHVDDATLVAAYNRAKFAVFTPILEPLGFVPLEAAACGIPTVGVREAGVRETVRDGETGLLVEPEAGALARAIAELLADEPRRARLGEQALANVHRHWTWERSAELFEEICADLLAAGAASPARASLSTPG